MTGPRQAVLSACAYTLGDTVTDETQTLADLGADSLDVIEIVIDIEERLVVSLKPHDGDISADMTVAALIALVERVVAKVGAA